MCVCLCASLRECMCVNEVCITHNGSLNDCLREVSLIAVHAVAGKAPDG